MKYLVCELNDENYTDPEFSSYNTQEEAFLATMRRLQDLFWEDDSVIEITHPNEKIRICWHRNDRFYVIEILPYDEEKPYLLVRHHAYNGVDFEILSQKTSYGECIGERIRRIKKIFNEYDLSKADNEGFDLERDTCVDTGEEWEVFSVVDLTEGEC